MKKLTLLLVSLLIGLVSYSQTISTITSFTPYRSGGIALNKDKSHLYISLIDEYIVVRVNTITGTYDTIAGTGQYGYNGDSILAVNAQIYGAVSFTVDTSDNLYIADSYNNRVRKIDMSTGMIYTVAGTGVAGYNGDNIPAINAELNWPCGIFFDNNTNCLYISEFSGHRVRKVDASGIITTIAGTGIEGYDGDSLLATSSRIDEPEPICVDLYGNVYFFDDENYRIRKIDANTGLLINICGTGIEGNSGDYGLATLAEIGDCEGLTLDISGSIYYADSYHDFIKKIDYNTGILIPVAGGGPAWPGDGGSPLMAQLSVPFSLVIDETKDILYFVELFGEQPDYGGHVRKIINLTTSINDIEMENSYIYPNPTTDYVYLDKQYENIKVYSVYGTLLNEYNDTDKINLSSYNSNMYIAILNNKSKIKIIKQ